MIDFEKKKNVTVNKRTTDRIKMQKHVIFVKKNLIKAL